MTRRPAASAPSVSMKAMKAPPRFAPSTMASPAGTGRMPAEASVMNNSTAATEEWTAQAKSAPMAKAVSGSVPR